MPVALPVNLLISSHASEYKGQGHVHDAESDACMYAASQSAAVVDYFR